MIRILVINADGTREIKVCAGNIPITMCFIVEMCKGRRCVAIKHPASGATATACEALCQYTNNSAAFRRLMETDAFRRWHDERLTEILAGHNE